MSTVREGGDGDLHLLVRVREATDPLMATTVEDQRVFMRQTEAPLFLVAGDAAFGLVCRFPPERDADLDVRVLPTHRRSGVGSALYARLLEHARAREWQSLMTSAIEDEALAWLERRGFEQVDRQERVVLELRPV